MGSCLLAVLKWGSIGSTWVGNQTKTAVTKFQDDSKIQIFNSLGIHFCLFKWKFLWQCHQSECNLILPGPQEEERHFDYHHHYHHYYHYHHHFHYHHHHPRHPFILIILVPGPQEENGLCARLWRGQEGRPTLPNSNCEWLYIFISFTWGKVDCLKCLFCKALDRTMKMRGSIIYRVANDSSSHISVEFPR